MRHYVRDNDGTIIEITDRIRIAAPELSANADEGSVGSSTILVDDPDATFLIRGHRKYYAVETEAAGDAYGGVVYSGYTAERGYLRGPYRTGASRQVRVKLTDVNTILSRRLNVGNDCDRPAETDIARITWILATAEMALVENATTYVASSGGVSMDANDYTGRSVLDVIDDCAQQSNRNYYLFWLDDESTFYLWYDVATSEERSSSIRISNVLEDIDGETTFAPALSTEGERDPSRVYSGVFEQYDGGYAYVQSATIATNFAARDTPGRAETIKTKATAVARGRRYLRTIDTEEDTIPTAIIVPAALVNAAMQGERIEVKFSYIPDTMDWRWMRIIDRRVRELTPMRARVLGYTGTVDGLYELGLTLQSSEPGGGSGGGGGAPYAALLYPHGPYDGTSVYFETPGGPGHAYGPTTPEFTPLVDGTPPDAGRTYYGWTINATGTINVILFLTSAGVQNNTISISYEIRLNGAPIASETSILVKDGLGFFSDSATVSIDDLAVADGDILTAHVVPPTSNIAFFTVPAGVGKNDERFEITGGTLA